MATQTTTDIEQDAHIMDKYSRQIGAYGVEAMSKLIKMKVLIVGLRGVGAEIAKNLTLAGPGAVTIVDSETVQVADLGLNFFLREQDVGKKTRAEASLSELQELNRLVEIKKSDKLTEDLVLKHTALVMTNVAPQEAIQWNEFCRKNNIGFFLSGINGLLGYGFVDLGNSFTIKDKNGETPVSRIIDSIEAGPEKNEIIVRIIPAPDGRRHNLEDNDHEGWIKLEEVEGKLGEVVNGNSFRCHHVFRERVEKGKTKKTFDAYALRVVLPKALSFPVKSSGGLMTQVKQPVTASHRSLETCINQPVSPGDFSLLFTDGAKFGRAEQLHVALQGLWEYQTQNKGKLPSPDNAQEIEKVIEVAVKRNQELLEKAKSAMSDSDQQPYLALEEVDEKVIHSIAQFAATEFQPLSAFFGGVMAQEIIKQTGKYTPLTQWLHIDCLEVLPELFVDEEHPRAFKITAKDRKPLGSRYDDLIQIMGKPVHDALTKKSAFMVGCGALGCELLKNAAMIGLACSEEKGLLTVTDNDTIETSNLSRQFLFREKNVGQFKSAAAGAAVVAMNPALKVEAKQDLVAPSTENIFDDKFWESLDVVLNALDNVKARLYVDGRCVFFEKPLLESGTLGTKCNCQVVLPHLTQSYSDGPQGSDDGDAIPMCTLRNFPSEINHCVEWARARFTDCFSAAQTAAAQFLSDPDNYVDELRKKTLEESNQGKMISAVNSELAPLKEMVTVLKEAASPDICFAECVKKAFVLFHRFYRDPILSLIKTYPRDAKDREGNLFWSGTKRFPDPAEFDASNPTHMGFIISTANIFAVNLGLQPASEAVPEDHPWRSPKHVEKILSSLKPPAVVQEKVDMSGGGEEEEEEGNDGEKKDMEVDEDNSVQEFQDLLKELETMKASTKGLDIEAAEFEKDDDTNHHIDWITAAGNLRATNYKIKPASRHQAKMIAGKIIPALATTTAAVTGLVMIELLKAIQPGKKLEAFKDSSNSLGINGYFFSEPSPPIKEKDEYDPIEMSEVKCLPKGFSKWDKTLIKAGNLTLSAFLEEFKKQTGLNCTTLYHKSANISGSKGYSKFIYEKNAWKASLKETYAGRLNESLVDVVDSIYGEDALGDGSGKYVGLEVSAENDDDDPFKVPSVVYYFK